MKKVKYFFILVLSITYGCSSLPESPSYADISAQYEAMKKDTPARIVYDFGAACNDESMCYVAEDKLTGAAKIITEQNTAYQESVSAYNSLLDALKSKEYTAAERELALAYQDRQIERMELSHSVKQGITYLGMVIGAGLCAF